MYVTLTVELAQGQGKKLQEILNAVQSYEIHYRGTTKPEEVNVGQGEDAGFSDGYGRTSFSR